MIEIVGTELLIEDGATSPPSFRYVVLRASQGSEHRRFEAEFLWQQSLSGVRQAPNEAFGVGEGLESAIHQRPDRPCARAHRDDPQDDELCPLWVGCRDVFRHTVLDIRTNCPDDPSRFDVSARAIDGPIILDRAT